MERTITDLAAAVARHGGEGLTPTAMPNVGLYKVSRCIDLLPETYRPIVSLVLQGEKQLLIGDEVLTYHAGHTFTAALDLPVMAKITKASTDRPYLAISLAVEARIVADLTAKMPDAGSEANRRAFAIDPADHDVLDAWRRMLGLIDRPQDVQIMAPLLEQEIVYRLLRGPQGAILKQVASADARVVPIRKALALIGENYTRSFQVEEIARSVGMSSSAFHRRFKAATGMAPLQYQKTLRLYEARRLLLTEPTSASAAAFAVGYQSMSQFSREYRRLFGIPPKREARTR
jgi:AraC-like DNA-binding protein